MAFSPKKAKLLYRDYCDADDEKCKALEMRAMQGSRFPKLQKVTKFVIRAGFEHHKTFDAKARQYEDCVIRVVEDTADADKCIVGVCCAALKTVKMHSQTCKVAYLFDLRVDERYQGRGIGKTLAKEIDEACIARGARYAYLTVNNDNVKAKALYEQQGFVHASHRAPAMSLLAYPDVEVPGIAVERISAEEGQQLTEEAYSNADLALHQLECLFGSPLYEGTFIARSTSGSYAGVSAWNGSSLTGFKIDRLLLPLDWWRLPIVQAACVCCGALAGWRWTCLLQRCAGQVLQSRGATDGLTFLILSSLTALGSFAVWKAWPLLSFIAGKLLYGDSKLRFRMFGAFASGPALEQEQLMRAVVKHVNNIARKSGYAMCICNMDQDEPLRPFFPTSKFRTTFLYKKLEPNITTSSLPPLSHSNFFDPRDL